MVYGAFQTIVIVLLFLLFNDDHVLQRWSETITFLDGWYMVSIIYGGQMMTGHECGQNFLTSVLRLRENPGKTLNQKIDPSGI